MLQSIFRFFKSQDALGNHVTLHYKEQQGFGTVLGGCCSMFVSITVAFIVFMQFWAFFFKASFEENFAVEYLKRGETKIQEIPLIDFMPAFAVLETDPETGAYDWNNQEHWTFTYVQTSADENGEA